MDLLKLVDSHNSIYLYLFFVSIDKIPKNDPVVGNLVKVHSLLFNGLYRAKILKNNDDGSYNVFYIDFGNIETVQSNVIYEFADKLKKPGLVVKVGLGDY